MKNQLSINTSGSRKESWGRGSGVLSDLKYLSFMFYLLYTPIKLLGTHMKHLGSLSGKNNAISTSNGPLWWLKRLQYPLHARIQTGPDPRTPSLEIVQKVVINIKITNIVKSLRLENFGSC